MKEEERPTRLEHEKQIMEQFQANATQEDDFFSLYARKFVESRKEEDRLESLLHKRLAETWTKAAAAMSFCVNSVFKGEKERPPA